MNILLFNASNSTQSLNRILLDAVRPHLAGHTLAYASTADFDLPLYSVDLEMAQGYPAAAQEFYTLIASHDAVVLASPEHNGSLPAAFKNLFDWTSRYARQAQQPMFADKAVLLLSTSPGPNGGASNLGHLASLLPWQGAKVIGQHSFGPFINAHFSGDKANSHTEAALAEAVKPLLAA